MSWPARVYWVDAPAIGRLGVVARPRSASAFAELKAEGIDVLVSHHRDIASSRRFFTTSLTAHRSPAEVITDRAPALANVIDELIPAAFHNTGQYENNWC